MHLGVKPGIQATKDDNFIKTVTNRQLYGLNKNPIDCNILNKKTAKVKINKKKDGFNGMNFYNTDISKAFNSGNKTKND